MYLGVKIYTRRMWKKPRAKIGAEHIVKHKMFDEPELSPGRIIVEQIYRQPLGMMTAKDAYLEGGYNIPMFKTVWSDITKEPWEGTVPYVVKFRFILSDIVDESYLRNDLFIKWRNHLNDVAIRSKVKKEDVPESQEYP